MMTIERFANRMQPSTRIIHLRLNAWGANPLTDPLVTHCIAKLYPQERKVIEAKYIRCQTAKELGMTHGCFAVMLCLARRKIAGYLAASELPTQKLI